MRILGPKDLVLLSEVLEATARPHESEAERQDRACRLLAHFETGVTELAELIALTRDPTGDEDRPAGLAAL